MSCTSAEVGFTLMRLLSNHIHSCKLLLTHTPVSYPNKLIHQDELVLNSLVCCQKDESLLVRTTGKKNMIGKSGILRDIVEMEERHQGINFMVPLNVDRV